MLQVETEPRTGRPREVSLVQAARNGASTVRGLLPALAFLRVAGTPVPYVEQRERRFKESSGETPHVPADSYGMEEGKTLHGSLGIGEGSKKKERDAGSSAKVPTLGAGRPRADLRGPEPLGDDVGDIVLGLGSPQRHRIVPICESDGPTASYILAFAERQLLAEAVEELRQRPP